MDQAIEIQWLTFKGTASGKIPSKMLRGYN
jgi:hypothetical protein